MNKEDLLKLQIRIPALSSVEECIGIYDTIVDIQEQTYNEACKARADVMLLWVTSKMAELQNEKSVCEK